MASRFALPPMPSVSNVMPAIRISTVAALRLATQCCTTCVAIGAAQQAGEKRFGAGHPRGRDDVQHAGRGGTRVRVAVIHVSGYPR